MFKTSNKRLLPKLASSGLSGNHSTISKAGGANFCSPMLIYQSSPEFTISTKSPSIQTVYFRPTPVLDAGIVPKQLGCQKATDLKYRQKYMDVNCSSHTNSKRFQMPTKFLENIEQAKKDCKDSIAVYRVHYEIDRIKVFRLNPLIKRGSDGIDIFSMTVAVKYKMQNIMNTKTFFQYSF